MTTAAAKTSTGRFVAFLNDLLDRRDRAALAALRRATTGRPELMVDAHRYVQPWLPRGADAREEAAYYLIAGLFASHGGRGDASVAASDLGGTLASIRNDDNEAALERRFIALLAAVAEDMPVHLRHMAALVRQADAPIRWEQLLRDVLAWERDGAPVQLRWARSFWRHPPSPDR